MMVWLAEAPGQFGSRMRMVGGELEREVKVDGDKVKVIVRKA